MPEQYSPAVLERFWAKVNKNGPIPEHRPELGACWEWTAGRFLPPLLPYGRFKVDGRTRPAHAVALTIAIGRALRPKHIAAHHCDYPPCVRDEHLFETTKGGNNADRDAKGRTAKGDTLHPERRARGERQWKAKLTAESVQAIRRAYAAGGVTQAGLARQYGVQQAAISNIVRGLFWKHVD